MTPLFCQDSVAPVAVVGAGNWLISCDRIGPDVIQRCRKRFGPDVDLIEVGSTSLALLDHMANQDLMIIVDACCRIGHKGEIIVWEFERNPLPTTVAGSHQIGVLETLAVANVLYPEKLPRKTLLILAETNGLNDVAMENTCDRIISVIEEKIETWQQQRH